MYLENKPLQVFVDTNVLLDVLIQREDASLSQSSAAFLDYSDDPLLRMKVSTLSLCTILYVLRKLPKDSLRKKMDRLLKGIEIVGTPKEAYDYVWKSGYVDLEDAMQTGCAIESGCSLIVTNNVSDYSKSPLQAMTPDDFLKTAYADII